MNNIHFSKISDKKYVIACTNCQFERCISYSQLRNIINKKSTGKCSKCVERKITATNFPKGNSPWNKGINFKAKRSYEKNKKQMEIINVFGGIVFSEEIKNKMRDAKKGKIKEEANNWKGGSTRINLRIRSSRKASKWRAEVMKRDENICVKCKSDKNLHVHHIKEFSKYPDLRWILDNGITLCKTCHKNEHKKRGKKC